jgi:chitin disaccharide deacetylase
MAETKYLIVNADDFGQSPGVNRGVIRAYEQGIVTSASLMVRWPYAAEAAAYAKEHPELSLGLHLDLGEWAFRDGEWVCLYEVVSPSDETAVADELARQLDSFRQLTGKDPTHLDSHQHVHRDEPLRSMMVDLAEKLCIPLRDFSSSVSYCGNFYGQSAEGCPYPEAISVEGLITTLEPLPIGVTELGCHPAERDDLEGMYTAERRQELKALCDPRIRAAIADLGIELTSFDDLKAGAAVLT